MEYVTADRFVMRRASDGAVFDWRVNSEPMGQYLPVGGNHVLSDRGGPNGLGRRDLVAGETYTLQVVVGSRTIVGGVTIPSRPDPRVVVRPDGQRVVEWPRDSAAGIYELDVQTDFPRQRATTDTFYVLREDAPGLRFSDKPRFQITAKDTNWYRYLRDNLQVRGGQNGFGVVGAMSRAEILIPPR